MCIEQRLHCIFEEAADGFPSVRQLSLKLMCYVIITVKMLMRIIIIIIIIIIITILTATTSHQPSRKQY
jgi:hypothetical protein